MLTDPPVFIADPRRTLLAIPFGHPDYAGPERVAWETRTSALRRNDDRLAATIGRAWRSGAPESLIDSILTMYAAAHGLDQDDRDAIVNASRFAPARQHPDASRRSVRLMRAIEAAVLPRVYDALADAQEDCEPCACPACVAEVAGLN
jgi:hypothetical protein